jgi:hypothetical protein
MRVREMVKEKGEKESERQRGEIEKNRDRKMPGLRISGLYEKGGKEVIIMEDGVVVSRQKEKRDGAKKEKREKHIEDIIIMENGNKYEEIVCSLGCDMNALLASKIKENYGGRILKIVVISDGATSIKNRMKNIFGEKYVHILDWYHLKKKTIDLVGMMAVNKKEKEEYISLVNNELWKGATENALKILKGMPTRNIKKQEELEKYLTKNKGYIIDYERRQKCGKTIGSGRMEKTVDKLVARRQKSKGKSWSRQGSNSLAMVTASLNRAG